MDCAPSPQSTLRDADGWWLDLTCACGHRGLVPCRMLARQLGPGLTVSTVAARLRCKRCGDPPEVLELVNDPQADAPGYVATTRAERVRIWP